MYLHISIHLSAINLQSVYLRLLKKFKLKKIIILLKYKIIWFYIRTYMQNLISMVQWYCCKAKTIYNYSLILGLY